MGTEQPTSFPNPEHPEATEFLTKYFGPDLGRREAEYDKLRARMIHFFAARRCPYADELADEVIMRAWKQYLAQREIPDLTRFCYGIAFNLYSEKRKKKKEEAILADPAAPGGSGPGRQSFEERLIVLRECLAMISPSDRDLLRDYYCEDREKLAALLQLTPNALRLRVFHALSPIRRKAGIGRPSKNLLKRDEA
jgi:DNA-directed RNA polymerase specialized sigma24 family protein